MQCGLASQGFFRAELVDFPYHYEGMRLLKHDQALSCQIFIATRYDIVHVTIARPLNLANVCIFALRRKMLIARLSMIETGLNKSPKWRDGLHL